MTIKFHYEEEQKENNLTFDMVEEDQFFISGGGNLCQKNSSERCVELTKKDGAPCSIVRIMPPHTEIEKILPKVTKITWE